MWVRVRLQDAASSLLASFATGIQADDQAVAAAISEPWSNGQTEGHITKLKLVKRHVWTPPRCKKNLVDSAWCGHVSGLFARREWPLALMVSAG